MNMQPIPPGSVPADFGKEARERLEKQTPEQREKAQEARRQRSLRTMKLINAPTFAGNENICNRLKGILYDVSDMGQFDENYQIAIWRINEDLKNHLIQVTPGETAFHKYLQNIYKLVSDQYDKHAARVRATAKADQDHIENRKNVLEFVQEELRQQRSDQVLQAEQKRKPDRVFTDAEKGEMIHVMAFSLEDLTRSRQHLTDKKVKLLKEIRDCDEAIEQLEVEKKPFLEKVNELRAKLAGDLSEADYKELKLSCDYNQDQADKLQEKKESQLSAKEQCQKDLEPLDTSIEKIDCALDGIQLLTDVKNWRVRTGRVRARIERVLKGRDELIALAQNLNDRWKELTGDMQPLCEPLTLKADSRLFFI